MSKSWQLSRRRMLKGLGAAIALPWLEAMGSSSLLKSSSATPPTRSAFFFMPNGVHPEQWTPTTFGRNFELSPILRPLAKVKDDILVLNELMNQSAVFKGADGHYAKTSSFLTSQQIYKTTGDNIHSGGISIDQLIAQNVGQGTLFGSLEYGLERINSGIDANVGFTRLYGSSIAWKSATQPCSKEIDPRMAFNRLFRSYLPNQPAQSDVHKQSVLDLVLDDAHTLQRKLGRTDQDKLEEYLESIRSVEKRIDNQAQQEEFAARLSPDMIREMEHLNLRLDEFSEYYLGTDVTEKTRLMFDIMALAFWSDASRVTSFMFGNSVSNRNFSFLDGVQGSHHQLSHHQNSEENLKQYAQINQWHMEQYAYFLEKLKSIPEVDGTLLDHSMIMLGSGLRDGNRHSPRNLPIVVAGKAGGKLKTGQNLQFAEETPLANLYLSMLHVLDIPTECFADSTGELCEIYA
ncbi:MAG: DUF1552 domain-containing protein [Bacteroidota bacterium]